MSRRETQAMALPILPQSGVIPYRREQGQLQVLVITSSDGLRWVVPKGLIEPDLTPVESACMEALEEAGVTGNVSPNPFGSYTYVKWGKTCRVEVFGLEVTEVLDRWQEMTRTREWVSVEEAAARVSDPGLRALLRDLPNQLGQAG
jgi:8-oxo-dGTP pyrophosphatase MutT (NUDIX family)